MNIEKHRSRELVNDKKTIQSIINIFESIEVDAVEVETAEAKMAIEWFQNSYYGAISTLKTDLAKLK